MDLYENLAAILFFFSLGYIFVRFRIFPTEYSKAFTDFIIKVGFPGLVFYNIYNLKPGSDVILILLAGYLIIFISLLISFYIGKWLKFDRKTLSSFMLVSSFGNTGFLGYPFVLSLYGEEGLRYAVIFDQLAMFLPIYLLAPLIVAYGKEDKKFSIDIKKILLFPPFIALFIAFILKPFTVPSIILNISQTLGKTVIPLILFSVGINLRFYHLKERLRDISFVITIKNFILPFILLGFICVAVGSVSLPWKVAVIETAMPPMVLASIFVIDADLDKDLAVSSVAAGILVSFFSVPFIYFLVNICGKL
ncbi:MAG: AEC family transporter [Hydrogenothermaceae bacterium]|nr:AEC family transporter [Hydrogenothermaceae bacterium]